MPDEHRATHRPPRPPRRSSTKLRRRFLRRISSAYRSIVAPGVATTVLSAFLFAWTEFLGALTFPTDNKRLTLPIALLNVQLGAFGTVNVGDLVAGAVIATIPASCCPWRCRATTSRA
ncbi:MAG: hypothetical protein M0004_12930 [Actinomycetota bacterium]|nr:hypothetical protein [Actinomycetota bacterium]